MNLSSPTYAIILAGGIGTRFNNGTSPKQLIKIGGEPIIYYTIKAFEEHSEIQKIIIVGNKENLVDYNEIVKDKKFKKVIKIIQGGKSRQDSTKKGLKVIPNLHSTSKVLVHDAVRPFLSDSIISKMLSELDNFNAVDVGIPIADTIIEISNNNIITSFPVRSCLMRGQTPQGFRAWLIKKAHKMASKDIYNSVTDDCGLIFKLKLGDIKVIEGEEKNMKITYPIDIHLADKIFQVYSENYCDQDFGQLDLTGKRIIVFGHTGGIGKQIYNLCRSKKAEVIGFSKSLGFDITDLDNISNVVHHVANKNYKIDFVFDTIGELLVKPFIQTSNEEITRITSVNFNSHVFLVRSLIPYMKNNSSIALFTSSSYTRGRKDYSLYSSSKAAIANFVQALGDELKDQGIRINAICPTRTNTKMRIDNFGTEDPSTLLSPKFVAEQTILIANSKFTGQIINIRKNG